MLCDLFECASFQLIFVCFLICISNGCSAVPVCSLSCAKLVALCSSSSSLALNSIENLHSSTDRAFLHPRSNSSLLERWICPLLWFGLWLHSVRLAEQQPPPPPILMLFGCLRWIVCWHKLDHFAHCLITVWCLCLHCFTLAHTHKAIASSVAFTHSEPEQEQRSKCLFLTNAPGSFLVSRSCDCKSGKNSSSSSSSSNRSSSCSTDDRCLPITN